MKCSRNGTRIGDELCHSVKCSRNDTRIGDGSVDGLAVVDELAVDGTASFDARNSRIMPLHRLRLASCDVMLLQESSNYATPQPLHRLRLA